MHQKIKNFVRENSWYTIGSNITNILNYANTMVIGKLLGPSGVGDIGAFTSYIAILSIPTAIVGTFVTQTAVIESRASSAFSFYKKYIFHYIFALGILTYISTLFEPNITRLTNLSYIGSILLVPNLWLGVMVTPLMAITLSGEKYKANVLINIISTIVKISAIPAIILLHLYSSDISIICITLGSIVSSAILYFYLNNKFEATQTPSIRKIFLFVKEKNLAYTVLGSASMILLVNIDVVLARKLFDIHTAGIYATWSLLSKVVFFTLGPILTISFVRQAKVTTQDKNKLDPSVMMIVFLCILSIIPLYLSYQFIAPILLKSIFGSKFDNLYEHLGLSGIFGALTLLLNHLTNTHIAKQSWMSLWTIFCVGIFAISSTYIFTSLSAFYMGIIMTVAMSSLGLLIKLKG